jgi:hypothetical protein
MNYEPVQIVANTSGGVSTVAIKTTGRGLVAYEDTGDQPVSGIARLLSGAAYSVNGTWRASTSPGVMRAVVLCRGASMQAANDLAETLYDLAGRTGVLYGIEYTASSVATHTCNVEVSASRPISMLQHTIAAIGKEHVIQVEMVFTRTNAWS